MRILLYLAFLSVLSLSCSRRWCNTRFPPTADTIRITSVRDSIIYRDTTILLEIEGEIQRDSIPIPCPEISDYFPDTARAETSLAKAWAWWAFPRIQLKLVQKDTTITKKLYNAIKEAHHWRFEYERIKIKPEAEKYIPGIYRVAFWMWIGAGVLILFIAGFKIFK